MYLVKLRYVLEVNWRDLNNDERAALQSNSGVYVTSVVNDTPAFHSDILAGDIIVKIDGQPIYGQKAASEILGHKRGEEISITIFRNSQFIKKQLMLAQ